MTKQLINTQALKEATRIAKALRQGIPVVKLADYDVIVVNTSAGKDSSVMLHQVVAQATAEGVLDRLVAVHATFQEEWAGTEELAQRQCDALGVRLVVVQREVNGVKQNLLDYVEQRGKWMASNARFCTSEFKRDPCAKVIRRAGGAAKAKELGRAVKVLNCIGVRAGESDNRADMAALEVNKRLSADCRQVTDWHPIFTLSEAQVWAYIRKHGIQQHKAYSLGMPRLSCCFCFFANRDVLLLAGEHNPELLAKYVAVEKRTGHQFTQAQSITEIQTALANGERANPEKLTTWDA